MNNNKQQLLLEYLVSSADTFAVCKSIVKSDYFNPEYRKAVDFIHKYYDNYNALPTPDQVSAETSVALKLHEVTRDQVSYCSDEVEQFCKRKAIEHAVLASPALIDKGDYGQVEQLVKDAISVSLNRDMGLSYFADPLGRLEELTKEAQRTPTMWKSVDDLMNGGLARTELLLLSANSGGGKSITLANLAENFLFQNLNVLYISLELSEEMIAQRFDTMFTGVPTVNWKAKYKDIASTLTNIGKEVGKLTIKRMHVGTNANAIRAYLKEFELTNGYLPDLLIVDYLDIMGPNQHVSADNISEKDKQASEQLRDILFDYNMFGATASQQNRSAIDAQELNHSHIAGGLTKVNTVDWYISIILTPTMKAAGEIGFTFLKSRSSDAVGKTIYLQWDNNSLRIKNPKSGTEPDEDGVIEDRVAGARTQQKSSRKSLLDVMNM